VVNFDLWLCAACWPGDPNDAAHDATERAAIMAEAGGGPAAEVLHHLPVSWADPAIAQHRARGAGAAGVRHGGARRRGEGLAGAAWRATRRTVPGRCG
ncbi:unnamed protein product, partial [Acidocella sp. C78]